MVLNIQDIFRALLGGCLIGLAATLMLFFNGRITGVSGILYRSLFGDHAERFWRWSFVLGLLTGALLLRWFSPQSLSVDLPQTPLLLLVGGLLVGYGTVLGNGCTSGHGVCGISRFSLRSLSATLTFMLFGFFAASLLRSLFLGGPQ